MNRTEMDEGREARRERNPLIAPGVSHSLVPTCSAIPQVRV